MDALCKMNRPCTITPYVSSLAAADPYLYRECHEYMASTLYNELWLRNQLQKIR